MILVEKMMSYSFWHVKGYQKIVSLDEEKLDQSLEASKRKFNWTIESR